MPCSFCCLAVTSSNSMLFNFLDFMKFFLFFSNAYINRYKFPFLNYLPDGYDTQNDFATMVWY